MKFLRFAFAILLAMSVSACANTIRGVGKDLKETGRAVSDTVS